MSFFTDMPFGQAPSGPSNPTKIASLPYGGDNHGQALRATIHITTEYSLAYVESLTSKRLPVVNPMHKRSETELAGAGNQQLNYLEEVVYDLIDICENLIIISKG